MTAPKTVKRGPWPGKGSKQFNEGRMRIVDDAYVPESRQSRIKGLSIYAEYINALLDAKPGSKAIEFDSVAAGKAFVHSIKRYMDQNKLTATYRPAYKTTDTGSKVWVIKREDVK